MTILRDRYVMLPALTLGAFFLGILPYPAGMVVFGVLLMMRVRSLRGSGKNRRTRHCALRIRTLARRKALVRIRAYVG